MAFKEWKNKGWRINAEPIEFIEQQEVNEAEFFQLPLFFKALKRYTISWLVQKIGKALK